MELIHPVNVISEILSMSYYAIPVRIAIITNTDNKCW